MIINLDHSYVQNTDSQISTRFENLPNLQVADPRHDDANNRTSCTESRNSTPLFPWKCTRTRRQAICEEREERFSRNGVTLKQFRKNLVSSNARDRIRL